MIRLRGSLTILQLYPPLSALFGTASKTQSPYPSINDPESTYINVHQLYFFLNTWTDRNMTSLYPEEWSRTTTNFNALDFSGLRYVYLFHTIRRFILREWPLKSSGFGRSSGDRPEGEKLYTNSRASLSGSKYPRNVIPAPAVNASPKSSAQQIYWYFPMHRRFKVRRHHIQLYNTQ
jgi:hypothetical protein